MNCDFDGNRPAIRFPPTFKEDCITVMEILQSEQESHDILSEDGGVR